MSEAIAAEIRTICRHAAEPIHPGDTVKEQIRRAWEALQKPPFWRVRSGFYGEGGTWSAAAVADFQKRYRTLMARRVRQHDAAQAVDRATKGRGAPTNVELARDEYRTSSPGSKPSKQPFAFEARTRLARRVMKSGTGLALAIAPWLKDLPSPEEPTSEPSNSGERRP